MRHNSALQFSIWPWAGWFLACAAGLFQFLLQTSSSVMIADFEKAFSLNALGVGLLSSSYFYTYLLCQIPAGMWIDRFKPRRTLFVCQLVLGVLCLIFSQASNLWIACLSRVLMGIVCAPTFVTAFYLIARTLPGKYFALVAGLTETMAMLGGVLGESLLARSVTTYGWRHTILVMSFVAMFLGVLAYCILKDELIVDEVRPASKKSLRDVLADLAQLLLSSQAWINGLYCGLLFAVIAGFGAFWSVPFLMKLYSVTLNQAADASAMIFIGAAIGTPFVGWLSDYLQSRRVLMFVFAVADLVVMLWIIMLPPDNIRIMFALIALLGFFSAAYLLPFAVIRDITPSHMRGTAMGYINMMCILIGSPIIQPVIGALLHHQQDTSWHAYQSALFVLPVCLLFAVGLAYWVQEKFESEDLIDLNEQRLSP